MKTTESDRSNGQRRRFNRWISLAKMNKPKEKHPTTDQIWWNGKFDHCCRKTASAQNCRTDGGIRTEQHSNHDFEFEPQIRSSTQGETVPAKEVEDVRSLRSFFSLRALGLLRYDAGARIA
ncbi:hypothetical protein ACLOJK_000335 [Asimina triloba]